MKDSEIILEIRSGKGKVSLEKIYAYFPMIRKMILTNGGNEEIAKDIFQDSVIVFYRMCLKPDFVLHSSIKTLVYAISRKMWLKKLRDYYSKESEWKGPEMIDTEEQDSEAAEEELIRLKLMENVLNDLGEPCRELLIKFYYDKISMREIAGQMGYSGEKTAKAQKYKCLERAKKLADKLRSTLIG